MKLVWWIEAARPRTLFLSLACTGAGNLIALKFGQFDKSVALLSIITTVLLQILSNFANDLGDTLHGVDSLLRKGPARQVQAGRISPGAMRQAVIVMAFLSFCSGVWLLYRAFSSQWQLFLLFLGIGLAAIAAAYFYTNGKKPYGYIAMGDLFVFVFFGLVAVSGTVFLHLKFVPTNAWYIATAMGLLATGVLNLNNMRDMASDAASGKLTIPLILGRKYALLYHSMLIICATILLSLYAWHVAPLALLAIIPLGIINLIRPYTLKSNEQFDKLLPLLSLSTFVNVLSLWLL